MSSDLEARLKALEEAMGLSSPKTHLPQAWLDIIQPVLKDEETTENFILEAIKQLASNRQSTKEPNREEKSILLIKKNRSINDELLSEIDRNLHNLLEYDLATSTWTPQENWLDIYHEYKQKATKDQSLSDWLESKKQQEIEEQAQIWLSLL